MGSLVGKFVGDVVGESDGERVGDAVGNLVVGDVLGAYATLQFFGLIHIFMRPIPGISDWELWRLFLVGFGIHIPA